MWMIPLTWRLDLENTGNKVRFALLALYNLLHQRLSMDRFYDDLPPRSASMPSPGTNFTPVGFQPMDALMYRKLSRRDSELILSEGPITPPESPGPESKAAGLAEQQQQLPHQS